jgi:hypothetical protein
VAVDALYRLGSDTFGLMGRSDEGPNGPLLAVPVFAILARQPITFV